MLFLNYCIFGEEHIFVLWSSSNLYKSVWLSGFVNLIALRQLIELGWMRNYRYQLAHLVLEKWVNRLRL